MEVLNLEHVGLTYFSKNGETQALDDISFSMQEGEFVSIVGPSGCGKTTILSIVAGLLKATKGTVHIRKTDGITTGYMLQRDELFEWRPILKNVTLGLEIQKQKNKKGLKLAHELLEKYGLKDFKKKHPSQLSGGMRQRVALIRTLVLEPEVLLLDEPFSALDYQTRMSVCDDVKNILKQEKKAAILVTHDISEAISMSDRVIVLTKRPATIKKEYVLNFDPTLSPLMRRDKKEFQVYFDQIWKDLQYEEE